MLTACTIERQDVRLSRIFLRVDFNGSMTVVRSLHILDTDACVEKVFNVQLYVRLLGTRL